MLRLLTQASLPHCLLVQMDEQVAKVMGADVNEDLRMTRQQVRECFSDVKGFYLPYPGEDVSESDTYNGDVNKIRPVFREMVEAYVRQLFCERLNVKRIHGREVTAGELRYFFIAYAQSFSEVRGCLTLLAGPAAVIMRWPRLTSVLVLAYPAVLRAVAGGHLPQGGVAAHRDCHRQQPRLL